MLAAPALGADDKKADDKKTDTTKKDGKDVLEKLVQETFQNIKDVTKILKDVQNKDQVEKAKKDLDPIFVRIADVKKRAAAIAPPTKEQEAEFEKKYKAEGEDIYKAFNAEFVRLMKSDYGKPLTDLIEQKAKMDAK